MATKNLNRDQKPVIHFEARLHAVGDRTILQLPDAASKKLPSRGQVAAHGTINGRAFETVLEPDGEFGHWMNVDGPLRQATGIGPGESVRVEVEPAKEWPEPLLPPDVERALASAAREVQELWRTITPMARWEWVRAPGRRGCQASRVDELMATRGTALRSVCLLDSRAFRS